MRILIGELVARMAQHGVSWPVLGYDVSHGPVEWSDARDGRAVERMAFGLSGAGERTFDSHAELGAAVAGWLAEHAFAKLYLIATDGDAVQWSESRGFWFEPEESGFTEGEEARVAPMRADEAMQLHAGRVALGRLLAWIVSRDSLLDVWFVGVARGRAVVVHAGSARGVELSWRDGSGS